MQMIMNSPQIKALADSNPQLKEILNNPELMREMFSPQNLQQMANMMGAMGNMGAIGMNPMAGMMNPFAGMPMGNPMFGQEANNSNTGNNTQSNVDPKEKYKEQLKQLAEMGFINEETNIQVLEQCNGNVQFAIERLLNMMG